MSLGDYQEDLQNLLHDQNYLFSSQSVQTRWINNARRECARRTGCVRRLISGQSAWGAGAQPGSAIPGAMQPGALPGALPNAQSSTTTNTCQTIPGVEKYSYQFFNPYLRATHAGTNEIIDVITCAISWGGAIRPVADWKPWEEFQAYLRSYSTLVESFPAVWSTYNDGPQGEIWLWPPPSQAGDMELDAFVTPADLNTNSDFDVIPDGMKSSIKYGAAKLSFMAREKWAQASLMEQEFAESMGVTAVSFNMGKTSSFYATGP